MFHTVIAGCDGGPSGQDALALAAVLGRPGPADLVAVGVYPDPLMPFPVVLSRHATMHEECERLLRVDRDRIAPQARMRAVPAVSPARALRHAVVREHADLLVLGSARHTERGRVHAGRHARQVLRGAPCAVALAPAGFADSPRPLRRLLVGFDDSREARDALAVGIAMARATAASLRVVTAVDPLPAVSADPFAALGSASEDPNAVVELWRRHASEQLEDAVAGQDGVTTKVLEGRPGTAICDAGRDADLLILGSRHWGPLSRLVLGGIGEYAAGHAPCPVLLVPRPEAEVIPPPAAQAYGRSTSSS